MSEYVYGTDEHEGHWLTGEEIVRCRDCMFAQGTAAKKPKTVYCTHFITLDCFENPVPSKVKPDGFCAWGKRRD